MGDLEEVMSSALSTTADMGKGWACPAAGCAICPLAAGEAAAAFSNAAG